MNAQIVWPERRLYQNDRLNDLAKNYYSAVVEMDLL
jgi:hypothetical protein